MEIIQRNGSKKMNLSWQKKKTNKDWYNFPIQIIVPNILILFGPHFLSKDGASGGSWDVVVLFMPYCGDSSKTNKQKCRGKRLPISNILHWFHLSIND
mmetsp:Transcript_10245/g.14972  ORF Transcript_10245/g.14972 Transcript_10245/m.14972 type:complete len:98 (+) Transcript_10245:683-976(+)